MDIQPKEKHWYSKFLLFNPRRGSLKLTEATKTYKGEYLGNVNTNLSKGAHCTDKPLAMLWSNYQKTDGKHTVKMLITVDNSGLKVATSNQGLTHYWCHRISHYCVPVSNQKVLVWIYRHVGKNLKVELRCHAILLKNEKKAKRLVDLLDEKVTASLNEYRREKTLKDNRRLLHEKAAAHLKKHGEGQGQVSRTRLLATSKNYKPPSEYSISSPTLQVISEEAADSSSDESDLSERAYSTLGRWTFKKKFQSTSLDGSDTSSSADECSRSVDEYSSIKGFATLPRHRPLTHKEQINRKLELLNLEVDGNDCNSDDSSNEEEFVAGGSDSDSGASLEIFGLISQSPYAENGYHTKTDCGDDSDFRQDDFSIESVSPSTSEISVKHTFMAENPFENFGLGVCVGELLPEFASPSRINCLVYKTDSSDSVPSSVSADSGLDSSTLSPPISGVTENLEELMNDEKFMNQHEVDSDLSYSEMNYQGAHSTTASVLSWEETDSCKQIDQTLCHNCTPRSDAFYLVIPSIDNSKSTHLGDEILSSDFVSEYKDIHILKYITKL